MRTNSIILQKGIGIPSWKKESNLLIVSKM